MYEHIWFLCRIYDVSANIISQADIRVECVCHVLVLCDVNAHSNVIGFISLASLFSYKWPL